MQMHILFCTFTVFVWPCSSIHIPTSPELRRGSYIKHNRFLFMYLQAKLKCPRIGHPFHRSSLFSKNSGGCLILL